VQLLLVVDILLKKSTELVLNHLFVLLLKGVVTKEVVTFLERGDLGDVVDVARFLLV
jgi:hypothetical protein